MTWTPLIVVILVVLWILLERVVDKRTPKIVGNISRILHIILPILLIVSTVIMLSQNLILTEGGRRIFNIVATGALISCVSLMIICSIVELFNGKIIRSKLKSTSQLSHHKGGDSKCVDLQ